MSSLVFYRHAFSGVWFAAARPFDEIGRQPALDGDARLDLGVADDEHAADVQNTLRAAQQRRRRRRRGHHLFEPVSRFLAQKNISRNYIFPKNVLHESAINCLLDACRSDFVVSTEAQLRQMMVEFTDHRMLELKRHPSFGEVIRILIPPALLAQFLAEHWFFILFFC